MTGTICMPLRERVRYLPKVLAGLARCQNIGDWSLFISRIGMTPSFDVPTPLQPVFSVFDSPDINASIIFLFDAAFAAGSETAVYLPDDFVPSLDMLRLARYLSGYAKTHFAFGLWWPSSASARAYPELVLTQRGYGWPKNFGCHQSCWPEIRTVLEASLGKATYDCALGEHLFAGQQRRILAPLCSRVKDIGEHGVYTEPERYWRDYAWVADCPDYTGDYMLPYQ